MAVVEPAGTSIRRERPELESLRALFLCQCDKVSSPSTIGVIGINVELVDPVTFDNKQRNDGAAVLPNPDVALRKHHLFEPGTDLIIGMDRSRDVGRRRLPRSQPHPCNCVRLVSVGTSYPAAVRAMGRMLTAQPD